MLFYNDNVYADAEVLEFTSQRAFRWGIGTVLVNEVGAAVQLCECLLP